jgi:hypothetical protein
MVGVPRAGRPPQLDVLLLYHGCDITADTSATMPFYKHGRGPAARPAERSLLKDHFISEA